MNLPKMNLSKIEAHNIRTEILETRAVLFAPTVEVWNFAKEIKADPETIRASAGRLPFEYTYFSFSNSDAFVKYKSAFPGALCEQSGPQSYVVHFIYSGNDFTTWFPISVSVDMETGAVQTLIQAEWNYDEFEDQVGSKIILYAFALIVRVVAMLSCKNLFFEQRIESVTAAVNRKRISKGKRPLFEHRVLDIDFGKQRCGGAKRGASPTSMRAHLVRGHFKQRKTGLFWWSPYARGNANVGIVNKNYSLSKTS